MTGLDLYQECQGVMTRFEQITAADVERCSDDGLTLEMLTKALEENGLDIAYVVFDPTRSYLNTYYADYDRGLYSEILLSRKILEAGSPFVHLLAVSHEPMVPELATRDYRAYYNKCVPLPMLIYDFQRRYKDIPEDAIFRIWHSIYKRIDYSNGMWRPEVLEYVFSHAPKPEIPPTEPDGLITIYRGIGELSQPTEKAISWSTHPGNALWFANHSGRGTHIAVARIRPEQIIAFDGAFSNENEVIVLPGTVTEYRYEDMIPAAEKTVPPLMAKALPDYLRYGRQAKALGYQDESTIQLHGRKHILRVLLLSLIYYYNSGDSLNDEDRQILIYFSLLHDIARINDEADDAHGERAVAMIHTKGIRLKGIKMTRKSYRIAELMLQYHCLDDEIGEAAIRAAARLSAKEKAHALHLYHICKDMDGLDRVRFNGLNYQMLRTQYGRRLPLVAGCLLREQLDIFDL